jgi:hypothetical protein
MPDPQTQAIATPDNNLNALLYKSEMEKTFIDKILDRQDYGRLQEIMKKEDLTSDDLSELLYLVAGIGVKLANYSEWDRYLLGKFYAWIRDFVTLCNEIVEYKNDAEDSEKGLITGQVINQELITVLARIKKYNVHNTKFLTDVFMYLSNSTLSVTGVGFDTLTKARFEYAYDQQEPSYKQPEKQSGVNLFWKGK